ncbi:protein EFR3 homolog B [Tanacetum coccineum]
MWVNGKELHPWQLTIMDGICVGVKGVFVGRDGSDNVLMVVCVRSEVVLKDIGYVSDLCRHLRKSLQATAESVGELELSLNTSLQSSIEDCLLEIAKGIVDARPLFDVMSTTLENLPSSGIVARTITRSMIILAHMIIVAPTSFNKQQVMSNSYQLDGSCQNH